MSSILRRIVACCFFLDCHTPFHHHNARLQKEMVFVFVSFGGMENLAEGSYAADE